MAKKNKSEVLPLIQDIAKGIYNKVLRKKAPELESPLRSLSNVKYDVKDGYFELMGKKKTRSLTATDCGRSITLGPISESRQREPSSMQVLKSLARRFRD